MASLARCSSCSGFVPSGVGSCPNCGASAGLGGRLGSWLKVAGGASVAMTLMACYGAPYEPEPDTDTDPTEGTVSAGETESSSGSSSGGAESTGGSGSTGGADSSGSGGSESGGSDGSTGAGAVDERPLPRRAG